MKKEVRIRKIDNLGRIVIPMDIRKTLEISEWDELAISCEGKNIVIKKAKDACTFCGKEKNLIPYENKFICTSCLETLNKG